MRASVEALEAQFRRMWFQAAPRGRENLVADYAAMGLLTDPNPPDYRSPVPPSLVPVPWYFNPPPEMQAQTNEQGQVVGNPPNFASENVPPSVVARVSEAANEIVVTATRIGQEIVAAPGRALPYVVTGGALLLLLLALILSQRNARG